MRYWLQRLGIAKRQQPLKPNEDLIIIVDHSNQIGVEKVLVVLGVNASALPEREKLERRKTFAYWKSDLAISGKRATWSRPTKRLPIAMEQHLRDGERLPMSTEVFESVFGLYKQLERRHSKSGY